MTSSLILITRHAFPSAVPSLLGVKGPEPGGKEAFIPPFFHICTLFLEFINRGLAFKKKEKEMEMRELEKRCWAEYGQGGDNVWRRRPGGAELEGRPGPGGAE